MEHTPLPWHTHDYSKQTGMIHDANHRTVAMLSTGSGIEAGKLTLGLVKAANNHDKLTEALRDCAELLESIHDSLGAHHCTVACPDIGKRVTRARAALAGAE